MQQLGRQRLGRAAAFGAVLVVVIQPGIDDGLRHGLAAGAAGVLLELTVTDGVVGIGGDGKPAVETGCAHGVLL
ncbi:hypothetical protein D3C72_2229030 [compost metagenome]